MDYCTDGDTTKRPIKIDWPKAFFEKNRFYRHRNCLDIDIHVLNLINENQDSIDLYVAYWNRHLNGHQGKPEFVTVQKKDLGKWKKVKTPLKWRR